MSGLFLTQSKSNRWRGKQQQQLWITTTMRFFEPQTKLPLAPLFVLLSATHCAASGVCLQLCHIYFIGSLVLHEHNSYVFVCPHCNTKRTFQN